MTTKTVNMINVTVLEDDVSIRDAISLVFPEPEYKLTMYSNGERIVNGDYEKPDIFLIDKLLPGIDGLDICAMLKKQETTKNIPVIMLSASPGVVNLATKAGADGFIEKPFRLKVLKETVNGMLEKKSFSSQP